MVEVKKTKAGPISAERLKSFVKRINALAVRQAEITTEISMARREISEMVEFGPSHTYMICGGAGELVKIGRSQHIEKRWRDLEREVASPLSIIRTFPFDCEVYLHHFFAPQWRHGEWFQFHPDMLRDDLVVLAVIARDGASNLDGLPRAARYLANVQSEVAVFLQQPGGLPKIKEIVGRLGCSVGKAHKIRKLVRSARTELPRAA